MITDSKMKFWIENNLNVLFIGEHGVGKTARVKKAFEESNLKWLYFSAATLDPWVDFIGIPKEVSDSMGNKYIELIRPKPFATDEVEAIFLDEFNRSPKKVRNAVMELLQFKSINGKKFNNLKIIWAAINPDNIDKDNSDDLTYDVEKLDPAQRDRFEIHVNVPYKPDKAYFLNKFGQLANNAIDWWNDLDVESKKFVSPRRLEYVLNVYNKNGDIRDVLPPSINTTKLIIELKNGSYNKLMMEIYNKKDVESAKLFIQNRNNYSNTIDRIIKSNDLINFYIPLINEEDLIDLMDKNKKIYDHIITNTEKYISTIENIIKADNLPKLAKKLKNELNIIKADNLPKLSKKLKNESYTSGNKINSNLLTFSNPILRDPLLLQNLKNKYKNIKNSGKLNNSIPSYSNYINNKSIDRNILKGTTYRFNNFVEIIHYISDTETYDDYFKTLIIISKIIDMTHLGSYTFKNIEILFGYLIIKCAETSNSTEFSYAIQDTLTNILTAKYLSSKKINKFLIENYNLYK
jgi:hypothetical protein